MSTKTIDFYFSLINCNNFISSQTQIVSEIWNNFTFLQLHIDQSTNEDPRMMALFDSLVRREIEGWSAEETDSHSGDDSIITTIDNTSHFTRVPLASHPTLPKDSDSSDSDQMLIRILPKRSEKQPSDNNCDKYHLFFIFFIYSL